jgi:hypothetical protein
MVALITDRELTVSEKDEVTEDILAMVDRLDPDPEWETYEAGIACLGSQSEAMATSMRETVNRR